MKMPAAVLKPQKRVLGDSTKAHRNANIPLPSPNAAKRRKLDIGSSPIKLRSSQNGVNVKLGSSQPKSQFEEEVLEKLTQDVGGLKKKNAEKDQQWERPGIDDFNEKHRQPLLSANRDRGGHLVWRQSGAQAFRGYRSWSPKTWVYLY